MRCCLPAILLLFISGSARAEVNWNQFRGPNADGKSDTTGLPIEWSEGSSAIKWKTAIPGKGWSSPVVWGSQVWLTTAAEDGKTMSALCVDSESGKVLHDVPLFEPAKIYFCHPTNSYASCTPFIEEGRVYVHFGRYGTACINTLTGEPIWKRTGFESDDFRGPASSPIVYGNHVFIAFDGIDTQFVVCLDKYTGDTVWLRDRDIQYENNDPDFHKAYGTAKIIDVDGDARLVSPSATATIAYEPETGETVWQFRHGGMNAAVPPLLEHGLLYLFAGDLGRGLFAVKPTGKGDVTESNVAWSFNKSVTSRSGPIIVGEWLFMVNDLGVATCLNAKTGEAVWQNRIPGGNYWSSPIYADGKIYFSSKDGTTVIIEAGPELEILAENKLDAGINASPAVSGKSILMRTFTHLYRLEIPNE